MQHRVQLFVSAGCGLDGRVMLCWHHDINSCQTAANSEIAKLEPFHVSSVTASYPTFTITIKWLEDVVVRASDL